MSRDDELLEDKHPLQAVVFCDSLDSCPKFRPVTLDVPKVLMPLVNVPMLDYVIELLAANGTQEIYLFCRSHADKLIAHVEASKFSTMESLKIETVVSQGAWTEGDALREMSEFGIKSDFILISGDVVSNMDLQKVLAEHKERRTRDKRCIMTMVFKEVPPAHPTRPVHDKTLVALDLDASNQILHFDQIADKSNPSLVRIESKVFEGRDVVQLRHDLMDCNILVCSPEILDRFVDDFDFNEIRSDFLSSVLADMLSDRLHDNKVHAYILKDQYAAKIQDLQTYKHISRDILRRWVYPIVPDGNFPTGCQYTYCRGGFYKEVNVQTGPDVTIETDSLIGEGTVIGEGSVVKGSIIGRNCIIGTGVTVENSFVWSGSELCDGCSVKCALVCGSGVKVGKNAIVSEGCILSFGVRLGAGFQLPAGHRMTLNPVDEMDMEDDDEFEMEFGAGGEQEGVEQDESCLLYTSPSPRDS
eukprot:TRINITY_DN24572_c0_g1_i2.p1 TRINITY_DN24572_c0_g1~~TRINITY_DN24572_c0_g1_i2.p1  ORF type:complete len:472 (+),score=112.75 TRINITY_DN24572_c0_g1_i2:154-1569(+)